MTNNDQRLSSHYRTPTSIRDQTFRRRTRGLDADNVYDYLDLLADQVQATERELAEARADNERLFAEVRRLQAELDDVDQVGERVNDQVVQLFSQAQLVAEEMVKDVSRDARERIGQARAHERAIVQDAMNTAGQQVREYARTAQAQMQSIMDSFASEIDRLGTTHASGTAASRGNDPLSDGWQISYRNGSGTESSR